MAKEKKEETANVPAVVDTIETENGIVSLDELAAQIEIADVGEEIGADYFKLEAGEEKRMIFVEMTKMNGMGQNSGTMIDAVRLLSLEDRRYKINADKVLVSTCRAMAEKGEKNVPILVTCKGMVKSAKGSYREITVNRLVLPSKK